MANVPNRGIPDKANDAFGEALILLIQWRGGADEPTVMLDGQLLRISMVFSRVANPRYGGSTRSSCRRRVDETGRQTP
jgi:hypothetical protein